MSDKARNCAEEICACMDYTFTTAGIGNLIYNIIVRHFRPPVPVEFLSRDNAHLALWQAIKGIQIGNKTDDKLIYENLQKQGISLAKAPITEQEQKP